MGRGNCHCMPSIFDLLKARASMQEGKATGGDNIAAEMVRRLPFLVICALLFLFQMRITRADTVCPSWWKHIIFCGILKPGNDKTISKWRLIALTSVLQKLFLATVVNMVGPELRQYKPNMYGFEPGRCTDDITEVLRMVVQKCNNWDLD
eukprot:6176295-Karenia_brevis.AAC.1